MAFSNIVRFDWAIKKLLRNKANYDVLEGFLSVLLGRQMRIHRFLDSESNQENENVVLSKDSNSDIYLIIIQCDRLLEYNHRLAYGVSKTIPQYISNNDETALIKKIFLIYIPCFSFGYGSDYIYKGGPNFKGFHDNSSIILTDRAKEQYNVSSVGKIPIEYFILKVKDFNGLVKDNLDEWIYYLKTGEIEDSFSAQGLDSVRTKLQFEEMSAENRKSYKHYLEYTRYTNSILMTSYYDGMIEGEAKGRAESKKAFDTAKKMLAKNYPIEDIAEMTGLSEDEIVEL